MSDTTQTVTDAIHDVKNDVTDATYDVKTKSRMSRTM